MSSSQPPESAASLSGLASLPSELLQLVCDNLDRPDLRSLRFTCGRSASWASNLLYKDVYLKRNMDSFGRLSSIATCPHLSVMVEAVHYEGDLIWDHEPYSFVENKFIRIGFQGLNPVTQSFTSEDFEIHNQKYQEHLVNQQRLGKYKIEDILLNGAFHALSNLRKLEFYSHQTPRPPFSNLIQIDLSGSDYDHLIDMKCAGDILHAAQFTRLISAARKSQKQIRDIVGYCSPLESLGQPNNITQALSSICHNATNLILDVPFDWNIYSHREWAVKRVISNSQCLEALEISFRYRPYRVRDELELVSLCSLFDRSSRWPKLKRLKLQGMVGAEKSLLDLLTDHASTLRSLELGNFELTGYDSNLYYEIISGQAEDDLKRAGRCGSWVSVILFLEQELNLENVRFYGNLSNLWGDTWAAYDPGENNQRNEIVPAPCKGLCLKHRIENFVIHSGEFPLIDDWNLEDQNDFLKRDKGSLRAIDIGCMPKDPTWSFYNQQTALN